MRATSQEKKKAPPKRGEWLGVGEARNLARQHLAAIQQGADPVGERRSARAARVAAQGARTVHVAMREGMAFCVAHPQKPWAATYARNAESALRVHLPPKPSAKPLRETAREEWTAFIAEEREIARGAAAFLHIVRGSFMGHAGAKGRIDPPISSLARGAVTSRPTRRRASWSRPTGDGRPSRERWKPSRRNSGPSYIC